MSDAILAMVAIWRTAIACTLTGGCSGKNWACSGRSFQKLRIVFFKENGGLQRCFVARVSRAIAVTRRPAIRCAVTRGCLGKTLACRRRSFQKLRTVFFKENGGLRRCFVTRVSRAIAVTRWPPIRCAVTCGCLGKTLAFTSRSFQKLRPVFFKENGAVDRLRPAWPAKPRTLPLL